MIYAVALKHLGEKSRNKGLWKHISLCWPSPIPHTCKSWPVATEKLLLQDAMPGIAPTDGGSQDLPAFFNLLHCIDPLQSNHTKKPRNVAENKWAWAPGPWITEKSFAFYYANLHKTGTKRAWLGLQASLFSPWCYDHHYLSPFISWSSKTDCPPITVNIKVESSHAHLEIGILWVKG